MTALNQN